MSATDEVKCRGGFTPSILGTPGLESQETRMEKNGSGTTFGSAYRSEGM